MMNPSLEPAYICSTENLEATVNAQKATLVGC